MGFEETVNKAVNWKEKCFVFSRKTRQTKCQRCYRENTSKLRKVLKCEKEVAGKSGKFSILQQMKNMQKAENSRRISFRICVVTNLVKINN